MFWNNLKFVIVFMDIGYGVIYYWRNGSEGGSIGDGG